MNRFSVSIVATGLVLGGLSGLALSQPFPPPADSEEPPPAGEPTGEPPVETATATASGTAATTTVAPVAEANDEPAPAGDAGGPRPEGYAIGLGFGWVMPTDVQRPNTVSARFRLASGLTFEPRAEIAHAAQTNDDGATTTTDKSNSFAAVMGVRYPLRSRGRVDLDVIGAAGVGVTTTNPEGPDNNSSSLGMDLDWGVGIDFWVTPHWLISMSATNPIFSYTKTTRDTGMVDVSQSTSSFGLEFDPTIIFMIHLFS